MIRRGAIDFRSKLSNIRGIDDQHAYLSLTKDRKGEVLNRAVDSVTDQKDQAICGVDRSRLNHHRSNRYILRSRANRDLTHLVTHVEKFGCNTSRDGDV